MKLKEFANNLGIWEDWRNKYNEYVPKFIKEASTKESYEDWEKDVFHQFFEQSRNQCVSSLQQGYFTNEEKRRIKNNWHIIAPLFKEIADSQSLMKLDVYKQIASEFRKFTRQNRRASTNRLIASLQPNLLCTIVNEQKLNELIDLLNTKFDDCAIEKTRNWYSNSNSVLEFFIKELGKSPEEIVTLPWQTYEYFMSSSGTKESNFMDDEEAMHTKVNMNDLQVILYGPPGTGKTYNTINKAIDIVDPAFGSKNKTRKEVAEHFRAFIYDEEKNPNGQIMFTTFHQSISYEDFIEGIKPSIGSLEDDDEDSEQDRQTTDLDYVIKDGSFKQLASLARKKTKSTVAFDDLWKDYIVRLSAHKEEKIFRSVSSELRLEENEITDTSIKVRFKKSWNPDEPEGTRPFTVSKNMIERLFDAKVDGSEENKKGRTDVAKHIGKGRATHIYSVYKDFYKFAITRNAFSSEKDLNYVMIIDEINRGNVSSIFGELITLLEPDKRIGEENELQAILPYSKEKFGIPSNLYIIGTMNTADRSVEALDTALRRRFSFIEMMPRPDLLSPSAMICRLLWKHEKVGWDKEPYASEERSLFSFLGISDELEKHKKEIWEQMKADKDPFIMGYFDDFSFHGVNLERLLQIINARIEVLIDRDHTIGHSYFMEVGNLPELKSVFQNKIIPLLQEYFFGNYEKMEMVIGRAFFDNTDMAKVTFAVNHDLDLAEAKVYRLRNIENMANEEFTNAIQALIFGKG